MAMKLNPLLKCGKCYYWYRGCKARLSTRTRCDGLRGVPKYRRKPKPAEKGGEGE